MANDRLAHRIDILVAEYQRLSEDWRLHTSDIRWYFWLAFGVHAFVLPLVAQIRNKATPWIILPVFAFLVIAVVASWRGAEKSREYAQECARLRTEKGNQLNQFTGLVEQQAGCKPVEVARYKEGSTFKWLKRLLGSLVVVDSLVLGLLFLRSWN